MLRFLDFNNIKYALGKYKHFFIALIAIFVAGLIVGAVFHKQIEAAQWLLTDSYSGTVLGSSFIVVLWRLFSSALLVILIVALTAAAPYVWWLTFIVIFYKSLSFISAAISLISCFSVIGVLYALVFLIFQAAAALVAIVLFILLRHSVACSPFPYIKILKENLGIILTSIFIVLILAFVISILIFLIIKPILIFI